MQLRFKHAMLSMQFVIFGLLAGNSASLSPIIFSCLHGSSLLHPHTLLGVVPRLLAILSAFRHHVEHMYFSHIVFAMRLHLMCHSASLSPMIFSCLPCKSTPHLDHCGCTVVTTEQLAQ